jgi:protein-L-isoaspartate(D-aspartate) O-methyltransferase
MNTEFARQQMIKQQVRAWNVFDANVLEVFEKIPRENFVPSGFEALAFADVEIPLGHDEVMMTPTISGRVLQTLGLVGNEKVLEIGTGTGFLTACLATLSAHVTSIDIHDDLLEAARSNIADCGIHNVELLHMDGTSELPQGSYDAIAVTGSIQTFDQRFADALRLAGRLFVVVGDAPAMAAQSVRRTNENDWETETQFETYLTPLTNGALPPRFSF